MLRWALVSLVLFASSAASAQSVRSEIAATNGITVTLHADEFANRYEYSAPVVNFPSAGGFFLVSRIKRSGTTSPIQIVGAIMYNGDWRFYQSALYRGGTPADYTRVEGRVSSCSGSRYGRGCSLIERFSINVTPSDVNQYAQDGVLQIQVRPTQGGDPVMLSIPVTYIEAVTEVSSR
jgi:hypothetical protein